MPSREAKTSSIQPQLDAGSIIVNPEKLDKLTKIVKISSVELRLCVIGCEVVLVCFV